ncbi:hypothetical protein ACFY04_40240 [Streptomyces sp. NPDC001549]|uniref:hypothetical protein n=1 Tax=Streptomyces sp. NPDC001549 TaxID=3364586 RepID=UPI00369245CA
MSGTPAASSSSPSASLAAAAEWPASRGGRPDALGAALATGGLGLLVFGVVRTDQYAWSSPVTLATPAVAVALLIAFVQVERTTSREPLVRLGLFANRSVVGANGYNLLVGAAMASARSSPPPPPGSHPTRPARPRACSTVRARSEPRSASPPSAPRPNTAPVTPSVPRPSTTATPSV